MINSGYLLKKYYQDKPGWIDGTSQFKKMISDSLKSDFEILDIGASRGFYEHNYKGRVKKVTGIDISADVFKNAGLDEAHQCDVTEMPFEDNKFDIAFADYVLEHLKDPEKAAREIYRVLKPGGRMFVRTPNFCHYATLASCVTPNIFHALLSVDRSKEDVFKVYYRCNTGSRIQKIFSRAGFSVEKIEMIEKEPSSTRLMKNACIFLLGLFYERIVNSSVFFSGIRASIFAEFRKPLK